MIRFACPGCQATYTVGDEKAGKNGKCPKCQSAFVIPGPEGSDAPPPPPSFPAPPPMYAPPPPPPPAADPNAAVEIAPCPKCQTRLSVSPADIGLNVQCPTCATTFLATSTHAVSVPNPAPPPPVTRDRDDDDDRPSRRRRRDDDDDDRRSRRIGTVEIKRIGVLSAAKMQAVLAFVGGLFLGLMYGGMFLFMAAAVPGGGPGGGGGAGVGFAGMGICFAIGMPLVSAAMGFIGGAINALLYNLVASATGGLEIDLE